ncbi:ATP-binding cassette domain-containing protein [Gammaproteobacteria bacterium LSUCC0057]|uniref:ATP-binding cassette domain-containing protein n=1 Tax=Gammaproteobacteria bacterium LSUCC0057 TaxID=2559237 RepID=A0A4Y8UNI3_9GAMM|nr:ATP-binding cassette domain-containing protein [Gammaproteobacteria bacterium LSUCC0057]
MKPPLLELRGATVYRGAVKVLAQLRLSIGHGESVVLLGRNGSGKSTLLKLLTREIYAVESEGIKVSIFGQQRPVVAELRRRIASVSNDQQQQFEPNVSLRGAVVSGFFGSNGLYHFQNISAEMLTAADQWIERVGLGGLGQRLFHQLSTGQQRRALIARALVAGADVLVLDEPTSGLDIAATASYLTLLDELLAGGTAVLLATHHIEEIPAAIERVVLFDDGRIVADGSKQELLTDATLSALFGMALVVQRHGQRYRLAPLEGEQGAGNAESAD